MKVRTNDTIDNIPHNDVSPKPQRNVSMAVPRRFGGNVVI